MAIIPLRAYIREIEGLIDNGQLDEAVAHCRHILTTYPKYIASYRLLGKAHLEQQRISDATDIFQRVLSAIPDDFVANVGMSIIKEDENNLDAAIWHMELAYEAQPSNAAIQDELRRLYGRRDGMQPPRVRLTRGALARMYAKGGLFDQAINELRAAISEDPNRPDLQLLLANMFFQTSQRVEAVETCVNILKKLPFCLEANRILAISMPDAEGTEAIKNYRQTVISMDPYFAFANADAITSDQVADDTVTLEKLDWKSGIQIPSAPAQPTWATSLGITLEKSADETLPEWLKGAEAAAQAAPSDTSIPSVSPFIWDTQDVEKVSQTPQTPTGEIPDWMQEAGWQPTSKESEVAPIAEPMESSLTPPSAPEELDKAEIPDWLRGIAPDGALDQNPPAPQPKEGEVSIPWLETHQPGPTDSIIQWLDETQPPLPPRPETAADKISIDIPEEEMPEWLKDLDLPTAPSSQAPTVVPATPAFTEELVAVVPAEPIKTEAVPSESFIGQVAPPEVQPGAASPVASVSPSPDVLPAEPEILPAAPETLSAAPEEELPDWLKDLAGEPAAELAQVPLQEQPVPSLPEAKEEIAATPEIVPAEEEKGVPEGLAAAGVLLAAAEIAGKKESPPAEEVPAPPLVIPAEADITKELHPIEVAAPAPSEQVPVQAIPAVPEAVPEVEAAAPAEIPTVPEQVPVQEIPVEPMVEAAAPTELPASPKQVPVPETPVVSEVEAPLPAEIPVPSGQVPAIETTFVPEAAAATEPPIPTEAGYVADAAALAWLESLATQQGTKEEELVTASAETAEKPEDWVNLEAQPAGEEAPAVPAEEIPDWIQGLGEEPVAEAAPETPLAEIPSAEAPVAETPAEAEAEPAEELPAWLLEMEQPEPEHELPEVPVEEPAVRAEGLPEWMAEIPEPELEAKPVPSVPTMEETPVPAEQPPEGHLAELAAAAVMAEKAAEPKEEVPTGIPEAGMPLPAAETAVVGGEIPPIRGELAEKAAEPAQVIAPPSSELPVVPAEPLSPEDLQTLANARQAIDQGLPAQAAELYSTLISKNIQVDEIIKDLQDAIYRFPVDTSIWVSLGDAYFKSASLQDALNAYTKAEELVR